MTITIKAYNPAIRSSTITPIPPMQCWLARAGNGLVTSKILNRTNPTSSTAGVSAKGATVKRHARDFVDDDRAGVLGAERALGAMGRPGSRDDHGHEEHAGAQRARTERSRG